MSERSNAVLASGPAVGTPGRLSAPRWFWAVLAFALLALLPAIAPSMFLVSIATSMLITALAAASLHLVVRTGHVSLGHAGFMGVGAYTGTLTLTILHWPFALTVVAGFVAPALLGLVIGPFVLRLTGKYFVLVTFILGEMLRLVMENWMSLTGGANGIFQIPAPAGFSAPVPFFYLVLVVTTVLLIGVGRILNSEIGRVMDAVRQSERLAQCSGIPVLKVKVSIFVLSCGLIGVAGVLQAWFVHFIDPGSFSITQSLNLLVINVIGGMNSFVGTLCGTAFLTVLPELLRSYVELQRVIFGIILIIVMAALPDGLAEAAARARRLLVSRARP
jgi:branched-chain amino acid transport system permease protein